VAGLEIPDRIDEVSAQIGTKT